MSVVVEGVHRKTGDEEKLVEARCQLELCDESFRLCKSDIPANPSWSGHLDSCYEYACSVFELELLGLYACNAAREPGQAASAE